MIESKCSQDNGEVKIDEKVILERLTKLNINKSSCPGVIHPNSQRECQMKIAGGLAIIFQSSLDAEEMPEDWQI